MEKLFLMEFLGEIGCFEQVLKQNLTLQTLRGRSSDFESSRRLAPDKISSKNIFRRLLLVPSRTKLASIRLSALPFPTKSSDFS